MYKLLKHYYERAPLETYTGKEILKKYSDKKKKYYNKKENEMSNSKARKSNTVRINQMEKQIAYLIGEISANKNAVMLLMEKNQELLDEEEKKYVENYCNEFRKLKEKLKEEKDNNGQNNGILQNDSSNEKS